MVGGDNRLNDGLVADRMEKSVRPVVANGHEANVRIVRKELGIDDAISVVIEESDRTHSPTLTHRSIDSLQAV